MHPRNEYSHKKPDFTALAQKYSDLAVYLQNGNFDFKMEGSVRALTQALLLEDFGIKWSLPNQNLCPALTRSLNYLHWIEDLLFAAGVQVDNILGIDIGCGASCIFPLLGCALHERWNFLCTDINHQSLAHARILINENNLKERIDVVEVNEESKVFPEITSFMKEKDCSFAFTMCNPPFFESEKQARETQKDESPFLGLESELWSDCYDEKNFLTKMIFESARRTELHSSVVVFTSMIGIKNDLEPIVELLHANRSIAYWSCHTLRQGKTNRWCVCWSFLPSLSQSPTNGNASHLYQLARRQKFSFADRLKQVSFQFEAKLSRDEVYKRLDEFLESRYKGQYKYDSALQNVQIHGGSYVISFNVEVKQDHVRLILIDEFNADRKTFMELSQKIQADILRTNRYWRRLQNRKRKRDNAEITL